MEIMSDNVKENKDPIVMKPDNSYDPSKQYTWDPEATFTLSGKEFGLWLNTIRGIVSSKEAMEIRMALECNSILENHMIEGVKAGIIKEMPKEQK
jgi:hypothetical protein